MRFPVAPDAVRFAVPLAVLAALGLLWLGPLWALPAAALIAVVLHFFRDPARTPPGDERAIVSAADGRVSEVDLSWPGDEQLPPGPRVGVFLSILDVHINRAPAEGEVLSVQHTPGQFLNALRPESTVRNESNLIRFRQGAHLFGVRQIAGVIARRIVCHCRPGDRVGRGQRIGLIRFGSRTEHCLPAGTEVRVRVGDRVRGGETVLGLLPSRTEEEV
jgi:phosphatidylserine decarboxylase